MTTTSQLYERACAAEAERNRLQEALEKTKAILLSGEMDGGYNEAVIASALKMIEIGPEVRGE